MPQLHAAFLDTVKEMFRQAGVKCRSFALKEPAQ